MQSVSIETFEILFYVFHQNGLSTRLEPKGNTKIIRLDKNGKPIPDPEDKAKSSSGWSWFWKKEEKKEEEEELKPLLEQEGLADAGKTEV